jgi:hypothetical protein
METGKGPALISGLWMASVSRPLVMVGTQANSLLQPPGAGP